MATASGGRRRPQKYPEELRERAVRMVLEIRQETGEKQGAVSRVARQLGIGTESLRNWVNRAEVDSGSRPGTSMADAQRIFELEREVRELRRANESPLDPCSPPGRPAKSKPNSAMPKGEYLPLAEALGLTVVKLQPGGTARLNPLDRSATEAHHDPDELARRQTAMVAALLGSVLHRDLAPVEDAALGWAVEHLARCRAEVVTLADVARIMSDPTPKMAERAHTSTHELGMSVNAAIHGLGKLLDRSLRGMFDGPTTVRLDPDGRGICRVCPDLVNRMLVRGQSGSDAAGSRSPSFCGSSSGAGCGSGSIGTGRSGSGTTGCGSGLIGASGSGPSGPGGFGSVVKSWPARR